MIRGKKEKDREVEIPQGSLADIAFLLLIFFLVTTTIDMDKGLGLVLPAKGEETEVAKQNISNLLINARGDILLDEEVVTLRDIQPLMRQKMQQNPKLIVSVKTDARTKYQTYIDVLDELKQSAATRISIANPE
ncbi:MAG: biopolymer transporter ExbD [Candidatus Marinimicrobia bacterium]|nr:biopolymer transporter ExbD [Candidatus Neomarinimicrobiota bacterium]MCF7827995.1 biopolymer transporter ExbD [Candidatus Neomarinimicrobiota bacterium]MCF7879250.1 biopolymer transporter ExbD [Candidatus Neomarinimicrobiota bacterium]